MLNQENNQIHSKLDDKRCANGYYLCLQWQRTIKNTLSLRHSTGNRKQPPKRSMKYLLMSARHTPGLHSTVTMIKRVVSREERC